MSISIMWINLQQLYFRIMLQKVNQPSHSGFWMQPEKAIKLWFTVVQSMFTHQTRKLWLTSCSNSSINRILIFLGNYKTTEIITLEGDYLTNCINISSLPKQSKSKLTALYSSHYAVSLSTSTFHLNGYTSFSLNGYTSLCFKHFLWQGLFNFNNTLHTEVSILCLWVTILDWWHFVTTCEAWRSFAIIQRTFHMHRQGINSITDIHNLRNYISV